MILHLKRGDVGAAQKMNKEILNGDDYASEEAKICDEMCTFWMNGKANEFKSVMSSHMVKNLEREVALMAQSLAPAVMSENGEDGELPDLR